ncbi:MAG: L-seryl-tRNA(Sec) selenium transferase [Dehalococcoidia bacterium]|nr:L-seryl-tRNA(Sec) selenium transferase [Dehalococcoidia bacterium]
MVDFRNLPSVESVLSSRRIRTATGEYTREWVTNLVREQIDGARGAMRNGSAAPTADEIAASVVYQIELLGRVYPRPLINATGVIIHTNLGRAPLSLDAMDATLQASEGYSNLELDLLEGGRGSRQAHVQPMFRQLTGAEAALVVNNNASAVLLGLSALAAGKEVIVSRGEEVEIGGGFRIPDVLLQSGAKLVEVGTTNRTYASDYEAAITDNTAALLKVHSSNFRIDGFTHFAETRELVEIGERTGIPVLHDVGSGCLLNTADYGLSHEPTPRESIAAGAGLVFFSGDKLLGGPQSGIVVGKRDLVRKLERHPLARAVRIDKMSLAALSATLLHYLKGEAETKIPIWRMISMSAGELEDRAYHWQTVIGNRALVLRGLSTIGGGSLPGETIDTWLLALECDNLSGGAQAVTRRLREYSTPVIARIEENRVILDPRTVFLEEEDTLLRAVREVLEPVA